MNRVDIKNMCKIINKQTLYNPHLHHLSRVKNKKKQTKNKTQLFLDALGEKDQRDSPSKSRNNRMPQRISVHQSVGFGPIICGKRQKMVNW